MAQTHLFQKYFNKHIDCLLLSLLILAIAWQFSYHHHCVHYQSHHHRYHDHYPYHRNTVKETECWDCEEPI